MMDKIQELILKAIQSYWHHPRLPWFLGAAIFAVATPELLGLVGIQIPRFANALSVAAALLLLLGARFLQDRLPLTRENHIGFVIAVSCESVTECSRIRRDFSEELRRQLKTSDHVAPFHVMILAQHQATKIVDNESALASLKECNAHFLVHGDVRNRNVSGEPVYALRLSGMVVHSEIRLDVSRLLANEMNAVLPLSVEVPGRDDLRGFELTSSTFSDGAKFVVATAALISGDIVLAERLLRELRDASAEQPGTRTLLQKQRTSLRTMVPERLADVYLAKSQRQFLMWRRRRDAESIQECWGQIQKYNELRPKTLNYFLTKAIYLFVTTKDATRCLDVLRNVKGGDRLGPHVRYAQAFLLAYEGLLDEAERQYRIAFALDKTGEANLEVEEFILWALTEHPDLAQLHYCLGLMNSVFKKDLALAAGDFRAFLRHRNAARFDRQFKKAQEFLAACSAIDRAANDDGLADIELPDTLRLLHKLAD